ncbi:sensor histidine kinase [Microbacterium rhizomatis]|uniref:histidine kinase n=1 Tax=Microbacterium rhizomatis TaxID=1631477 RepID=A0A5J5J528_9MICO|nr:HAMP domain-containing sensor histidine kinase [Microbacterium rhizomatis]KAA9111142.1 HAMP domain-containing histidine kinase [Microbacterium rhizomatis]
MSDVDDAHRVRRTARRIGLWVGAASAVVIAAGVAILVGVILLTSRPERDGGGGAGGGGGERVPDGDHVIVDVDRVVPVVIVLGIIGVVLLGVVAWFAARRSVRPLAEALTLQRNFVSDASHELRTPLTALTSRIQILQRRHARDEPIDETILDLRRNAAQMDDVLTDLLLSAEADSAPVGEAADPAECAATAARSLQPIAADRSVVIDVAPAKGTAGAGATAMIPAVTLTRLCVALIDNAIQHAPTGSAIEVTVARADHRVEIRVSDRGGGIRPEDLERIFERFARSGETGRRRGFGLGLSLVREVATRYHGSIAVEQTSAEGTTFLLTLPSS